MRTLYVFAVLVLLVGFAGGGHLLSRMDIERAERRAIAARQRLLEARLELVRAELPVAYRDVKPDNRIPLLVRRTDALRGAIFALVRTGAVSMPGDPGGDWAMWSVELQAVRR